jgi:tetratricopeptide (TPR) repeat protein
LQLVKGAGSEKELSLHHAAGKLYFSQGRYVDAVDHYTEARKLASGFGEKDVARALHARGEAWLSLGHFDAARSDFEEANARAGGTGDASTLRYLGTVHREMGHINTALELYQRALSVVNASGDVAQPLLLADIGEAHARRGELKEAEMALLEAVRMQEASVEASNSDLAVISTSLGFLYHVQGNVHGAVSMYRQSLELQSGLRPDHPELVATRLGHARAVRDLGDVSVALQMVEQLEWAMHAGAQEGPDLSRVLMLKAEFLRQQDLQEEAQQVAQEVLALQRIIYMEEAPDMAVTHIVLGNILHDKGQLDEALEMYKTALDLNMKTVGEDHPETAAALISIGTLSGDMGDSVAAEDNLKKGLEIQLRTLGVENPDVGITYNNLAMVLLKQGRSEEASDLLRKALDIMDAAGVPESHPDRSVFAENLSEALNSVQEVAVSPQPTQAVSI